VLDKNIHSTLISLLNTMGLTNLMITEALLVSIKETGLEVNAGRNHSMKIDNSSLKGWKSSNIWEQL